MPERFEIYIVYKRRYINTLPFLFSFFLTGDSGLQQSVLETFKNIFVAQRNCIAQRKATVP